MRFIHYGHNEYIPEAFNPVCNIPAFNKPTGGLWASPVDAEYGWADWCENEQMAEFNPEQGNSFEFELAASARVLTINCAADTDGLPLQEGQTPVPDLMADALFSIKRPLILPVDFESLAQEYDAILFNFSNDYGLYNAMYGWDCDSLLVLNKEVIVIR